MAQRQATRGRPRGFDTEDTLERAVELFWRAGFTGTTTRMLENELGLSQSSLYNAFGSKEELFDQVVARYERQLDEGVLTHLDTVDPARDAILGFLDATLAWIHQGNRRGCLVLNLASEAGDNVARIRAHRTKLRRLLRPALRAFTPDDAVEARTDLLVAAVLGLNISARSGATRPELRRLANGIKAQVEAW